jgi:hypothetical protein
MKKVFIIFALLAFAISFAGCGGGGGSMDSPKGENPGKSTLVELTPSHFVSHTNSDITLHAKVLDGNGNPVKNKPVRFTKLSPIGTLDKITDNTDANGIATVTLHSHEVGFATIQAEVDEGLNEVRDRIVVYYSDFALMWPQPTIVIDIDADNDGIYNEPSDFNFFETPTDDTATLRATAFDEFGKRIVGMTVTFSGDSGASFPLGDTFTTNSNGQAFSYLKVSPTSVVGQETSLLLQAAGSNGSADVITVFLRPVSLTGITMVANPSGVVGSAGETSTVTAYVATSAGTVPDDLAVQFSVSPVTAGFVAPLVALTSNGAASTLFTPSATYLDYATVSASLANVSGSVQILVANALAVVPTGQTIDGTAGGTTLPYTINGGIPPYTITTNVAALAPAPATVTASGGTFTVTVLPATAATTATYTVRDAAGHTATVTLDVTVVPVVTLAVNPTSTSICENTTSCSASQTTQTFTISGGTAPYTIVANPPILTVTSGGNIFIVDANNDSIVINTPVILTITDSATVSQSTFATVNVINQSPVALAPTTSTIVGIDNPPAGNANSGCPPDSNAADDRTFTITGGNPPYSVVTSNDTTVINYCAISIVGNTLTIDPDSVGANTNVTVTITDSLAIDIASVVVTVTP